MDKKAVIKIPRKCQNQNFPLPENNNKTLSYSSSKNKKIEKIIKELEEKGFKEITVIYEL